MSCAPTASVSRGIYDAIEKTTTLSYDAGAATGPLLDELRTQHELGVSAAYVRIAGTEPLDGIDTLAREVVPEISTW